MAYLPSGRLNASISGNTAGAASLLTAGTMYLAGGNNITLSQNGSTISFNAAGAAQASINFSASNASTNLASVNFANSYNMSFGLTNGSQIFGSASFAQSVQTQNNIQAIGAGGVTAATGTVVFSSANNISFGMNGQTVTASYAGGAGSNTFGAGSNTIGNNLSGNQGYVSGSNLQVAFAGGNNITLSQSLTSNSATITISGPAQSVQTQNVIQAVGAGGATITSGTLAFANSNNIGFGLNGNTITANYTAGSNVFGVSGGNAVNSGVVSGSNAGLVLAGGNNITLSQTISGGSLAYVTINGPSAGGSINFSASNTSANLASLTFSNGNGMAFGLNNGALTASYTQSAMFDAGMIASGNSAGTAGANTNGLYFVGGNNITLSQSTDAATGATITINGPAAAGGGTLSNWEPLPFQYGQISASQKSNAFIYFYKLQPGAQVSASRMLQLINMSMTLSSNSSYAGGISIAAGIYSANGSTLSLINGSSGSQYYQFTNSASNSTSVLSGNQGLTMPFNMNISPGNYWLGMWSRTTFTNAAWFAPRNMVFTVNTGVYGGLLGVASNATEGLQEGVGYVNVSSATLPTAMPISSIYQSQFVSNAIPYINFKNMTF